MGGYNWSVTFEQQASLRQHRRIGWAGENAAHRTDGRRHERPTQSFRSESGSGARQNKLVDGHGETEMVIRRARLVEYLDLQHIATARARQGLYYSHLLY